jgi:ATP-dependent DNA helicase RecG
MGEGVKSLLVFIHEMPGLRAPQLSKALGVPAKTLERWLKLLKERNRIEFRGSRRLGGYRRKELQNQETPSD